MINTFIPVSDSATKGQDSEARNPMLLVKYKTHLQGSGNKTGSFCITDPRALFREPLAFHACHYESMLTGITNIAAFHSYRSLQSVKTASPTNTSTSPIVRITAAAHHALADLKARAIDTCGFESGSSGQW